MVHQILYNDTGYYIKVKTNENDFINIYIDYEMKERATNDIIDDVLFNELVNKEDINDKGEYIHNFYSRLRRIKI